jgi:hypothetical protein
MSRVPFERVEPPEFGADDVGNELNRAGVTSTETGTDGRFPDSLEEGSIWLQRYVISKLKIATIIRAKIVTIPIKGTGDDFVVDREELMNLFPGSRVRAVYLETFESRRKLTDVLDRLHIRIRPQHSVNIENSK